MSEPQEVYVAHSIRNRVRIKFPARRHDQAFFARLRPNLLARTGVIAVEVNPMTASVLIEHDAALDLASLNHALCRQARPAQPETRQPAGPPLARLAPVHNFAVDQMSFASILAKIVIAVLTRQEASLLSEWGVEFVARVAVS